TITGYATSDTDNIAGDVVSLYTDINDPSTFLGSGSLSLNEDTGRLEYNIEVSGDTLSTAESDNGEYTVTASLTVTDTAQNTTTVTKTAMYQVDTVIPEADVYITSIAGDDWINHAESETSVTITGYATSDTDNIAGDVVSLYTDINDPSTFLGSGSLSLNEDTGRLEYNIEVSGDTLSTAESDNGEYTVTASLTVTDTAQNTTTVTKTAM
ncbi:hypothetical protein, partial [uncultured Shewanella sp.]|uniref:hypothetical protein n=1 Tax=uncultured Shewanella sp. TaxID=173975 RepID=UPI00260A446C